MSEHREEKDQDEAQAAPEIEAELVREPGAEAVFDEPATGDAGQNEVDDEAPVGAGAAKTLTPGVVVFVVFAVVALAAFFVWRFQMSGKADAEPDAALEAVAIETAPESVTAPASAPAPTVQQPAAAAAEAAPEAGEITEGEAKILNPQAGHKPALSDVPPGGEEMFLPPVGGGGNDELQRAAKEALQRFGPQAEELAVGEINEEAQATEPVPETELTAEPEAALVAASEEEALGAPEMAREPAAAADVPEQADAAGDKISNTSAETETLKAAAEELRAELAAMRAENQTLAARVVSLEDAIAEAFAARGQENDARLAAIEAGLAKLQNSAPERPTNAQAARLLSRLGAALDEGAPFTDALERLRPAAPADLRLDHLSALALSGAPTLAALKDEFGDAARAGLSAANSAAAPRGFSGLAARAQNLLSIRPARPRDGADAGSIIARAEFALEAGNVSDALAELSAAPEPMRDAMAPWLHRARQRAGALAEFAALQEALLGAAIGN